MFTDRTTVNIKNSFLVVLFIFVKSKIISNPMYMSIWLDFLKICAKYSRDGDSPMMLMPA